MSDTVSLHVPKGADAPVRRMEVFTGAGRRRSWSAEEKAAIVEESYSSDETVCMVARRYGLTHSQLFAWRRAARLRSSAAEGSSTPMFVPAVVASSVPAERARRNHPGSVRKSSAGFIEVEINGAVIRVCGEVKVETLAAVIGILKAGT